MKCPCRITNTGVIHGKLDDLLFHTPMASPVSVFELEGSTTGLAIISLMPTFSFTVFFNRRGLATKPTLHFN
ncbi:hypothetical protein XBO1_690004 [Xenorhabdus bovienii str. oregonense]|uniref:Uncharacterized protein n=1 Tax=Xenorhabdus bovienii str. oregonense TaxID=1398202 RepID=A0A077PDW6_XENBV|nr:hypothetical protein XBO1_690004 [Xenorhabdus bovienii str. oregonense]